VVTSLIYCANKSIPAAATSVLQVLFGWQRGRRTDYDSDAFQRAFSKFMNDKGWCVSRV
jgi:hypothetical protein